MRGLQKIIAQAPFEAQATHRRRFHGYRATTLVRIWPAPQCLRYSACSGWEVASPVLFGSWEDPCSPFEGEGWDMDQIGSLISMIPVSVRTALAPFFGTSGWSVLRVLHEIPEALDLVMSSPTPERASRTAARSGRQPRGRVRRATGATPPPAGEPPPPAWS